MTLKPITLKAAGEFTAKHHRHHPPAKGWKFGVSVEVNGVAVGVAVAARPLARALDNGTTLEVTRVCTTGVKNVSSMLYGALCRAGKALGYSKVITYTLEGETGDSVRAAGFVAVAVTRAQSWNRPGRFRVDAAPTCSKVRWERSL